MGAGGRSPIVSVVAAFRDKAKAVLDAAAAAPDARCSATAAETLGFLTTAQARPYPRQARRRQGGGRPSWRFSEAEDFAKRSGRTAPSSARR